MPNLSVLNYVFPFCLLLYPERTQMSPAQDDLDTADSLVIHTYSKENRTSSQHLLASDTSIKELLPSEDGNNISVENEITGTRIGAEEYSEMDATDTR